MTHWQHPRFFAYFSANASPASIIAEQLANYISANCMLWQTSPAATELEQRVTDWFRDSLGLGQSFTGVIHDSATTATFCSVLTMRERALSWEGLGQGLQGMPVLRVYATGENHSSINKAVRLSGIGEDNLVKVATDDNRSICPESLDRAIEADIKAGLVPAGVVLCVGGTSTGAVDRIGPAVAVARKHGLYIHVDAAWAGAAMICPEFRKHWQGIDEVDSLVINPHKWLGAQFDCSVQFLSDPASQIRTVGLRPDYLQSLDQEEIVNFNEWTIPLGRRFRALKLWFVFRAHGLTGLRQIVRNHIAWINDLEDSFRSDPDFEVVCTCPFSLFAFRVTTSPDEDADEPTRNLLSLINDDARIYLTQTVYEGRFVIRVTAGQTETTASDVASVYAVARELLDHARS